MKPNARCSRPYLSNTLNLGAKYHQIIRFVKTVSPAQKEKIAQAIGKADIGKWLQGRHGIAYQREREKNAARQRVRPHGVAWRAAGTNPHSLRGAGELFADVPDLLARIGALQPGKAMMIVQDEGDKVAVARLR